MKMEIKRLPKDEWGFCIGTQFIRGLIVVFLCWIFTVEWSEA